MGRRFRSLMGICLCSAACGGGDPASFDATVLPVDAGAVAIDAAQVDAGPGDGNDSFAQARPIAIDDLEGELGAIDVAADKDYFTFTLDGPRWLKISAVANPTMFTGFQPVLVVYDAAETQLAFAISSPLAWGFDPAIWLHLSAGTYYVEVMDNSTWSNPPPRADRDWVYRLVVEAQADSASIRIDPELGDDVASAAPPFEYALVEQPGFIGGEVKVALALGLFDHEGDRDAFAFTVAAGTYPAASAFDAPDASNRGTAPTRLYVLDATGSTILARNDFGGVAPFLPPGDYILWAERWPGYAGTGGFYGARIAELAEYVPELEDPAAPGSNDDAAGAEPREFILTPWGSHWAFIVTRLSTPTDVDRFSFELTAGEDYLFTCRGKLDGSGVRGLTTEIVAPDGSTTVTVENYSATVNYDVVTTGRHDLRIWKTDQDPEVTGDYVRCTVRP